MGNTERNDLDILDIYDASVAFKLSDLEQASIELTDNDWDLFVRYCKPVKRDIDLNVVDFNLFKPAIYETFGLVTISAKSGLVLSSCLEDDYKDYFWTRVYKSGKSVVFVDRLFDICEDNGWWDDFCEQLWMCFKYDPINTIKVVCGYWWERNLKD